MSDPFKELVEQMAHLSLPEDRERRRQDAVSESATPVSELDESDLIGGVDALGDDPQGAGADRANLASMTPPCDM